MNGLLGSFPVVDEQHANTFAFNPVTNLNFNLMAVEFTDANFELTIRATSLSS